MTLILVIAIILVMFALAVFGVLLFLTPLAVLRAQRGQDTASHEQCYRFDELEDRRREHRKSDD